VKRVLWIEDEGKIVLMRYKIPLIRAGYTVDIASDATEAIDLLGQEHYDAFVFDIIIPTGAHFEAQGEDRVGLNLLEALIKGQIGGVEQVDPATIIVFTVINDPELHSEIAKLGVRKILVKSLDSGVTLRSAVDDVFGVASEDVVE